MESEFLQEIKPQRSAILGDGSFFLGLRAQDEAGNYLTSD